MDYFVLPCLEILILQLSHCLLVTFLVEHFLQIEAVRNDGGKESLILEVSFFLHLREIRSGQKNLVEIKGVVWLIRYGSKL